MFEIVRMFRDTNIEFVVVETGLTLEEAQAHCRDPETSSRTCSLPERFAITQECGPWFEGYREE
jgi:hypothetical protein